MDLGVCEIARYQGQNRETISFFRHISEHDHDAVLARVSREVLREYRISGCVNMKIHFCDLLDKAQRRISLDETKGDDQITVGVTLSLAPSKPCGCGWMIRLTRRMACTYDNSYSFVTKYISW